VRPLGCNCSIVADESTGLAVVIDPGGEFETIRERLEARSLRVAAIVHTHTHFDHVGATAPLKAWSGAEAHIHEDDRALYDMLAVQTSIFGMPPVEACEVVGDLRDDGLVAAGGIELGVLHTPGHTPGSVCFVLGSGGEPIVFTGDTLFRGGIGRTDLWGGDSQEILRSLRGPILSLADETKVVPGHGPITSIGHERASNPYLRRS
jgi:hydroxyacylglutathione hydrolase